MLRAIRRRHPGAILAVALAGLATLAAAGQKPAVPDSEDLGYAEEGLRAYEQRHDVLGSTDYFFSPKAGEAAWFVARAAPAEQVPFAKAQDSASFVEKDGEEGRKWFDRAKRRWVDHPERVGFRPAVGAVVCMREWSEGANLPGPPARPHGHVALVLDVSADGRTLTVADSNWVGGFRVGIHALAAADPRIQGYLYSPYPTLSELGELPGGNTRVSLNERGEVASSLRTPAGPVHAVLWRPAERNDPRLIPLDLGALEPGQDSSASALNDAGVVAGEAMAAGGEHAVRWMAPGRPIDLGAAAAPAASSAAAINNAGVIAGSARAGQPNTAVIWDAAGVMTDLGIRAGFENVARAINNRGEIAGDVTMEMAGGGSRAFLWDPGAGFQNLHAALGHPLTYATAINDAGQVVGSWKNDQAGPQHAYLWTRGSGAVDLPGPPGARSTRALGINNRGDVVGYADLADRSVAIVWRGGNPEIIERSLPRTTPWSLLAATGINRAGQIAGVGHVRGKDRIFLLTPLPRRPAPWRFLRPVEPYEPLNGATFDVEAAAVCRHGTHRRLTGTWLAAQPGAVVVAPAAGKVRYAGPLSRAPGDGIVIDTDPGSKHHVYAVLVGLNVDPGIARGAEVKCGRRIGSAPMAPNASVPIFFALQDGGDFHFATLAATLPACGNPEPSPQFPARFTDPTLYVDRH